MDAADIRHGVDGWVLEHFEWSKGTAVFEYRRGNAWVTRTTLQPCQTSHEGWAQRELVQGVMTIAE